jgi:hypothetical protein
MQGPGGIGVCFFRERQSPDWRFAQRHSESVIPDASACFHGPVRIRAENGTVEAGTVHANCAGHPGSLVEFRHSDVKL